MLATEDFRQMQFQSIELLHEEHKLELSLQNITNLNQGSKDSVLN